MTLVLPLIDEHARVIDADAVVVWRSLLSSIESDRRSPYRIRIAALLGCADTTPNGLALDATGATMPGFAVVVAEPQRRLWLRGRHRFSEYALEFDLDVLTPSTTSLRARTLAAFPGVRGTLYRQLVIGTRLHVVAVHGMLRSVERRVTPSTRSPRTSDGASRRGRG